MAKDLIGQQLGNYRLMELLGSGGFTSVYLDQHIKVDIDFIGPSQEAGECMVI